ncbi:MAG: glycosyltransferase family 39 protein, partial [Crocinitomicaceae bacterium]
MDKIRANRFFERHGMFIFLVLIGMTFRLLFMYHQGLSNDELSAWNRTRFDSWIDFWHQGVKAGDMHPVFYQAFLWIWVRIFGDSEIALRAPSFLFYLVNSWIIYELGIRFFSKKAGLLVVAIYAGLGFTIIHTVFARPYNSGTFFLLLLVWSLLEMKASEKKISGWHFGVFIGFLGAMLSHYFAFLSAGVIGACALFYLPKRRILELLVIGFVAILTFLPHLPITLFQLNQGGLGWLPPPTWYWIGEFFFQFFNYSWGLLSLFLICILFACFRGNKWISSEDKFLFRIVLFTYLVGHLISVFYTPVLRELVMLFTLPFLLILVFSRFQEGISTRFSMVILLIPIGIGIHSIGCFKLLQPVNFGVFREIGEVVNEADASIGRENMMFASNFCDVEYINYYYKQDVQESITDWMNSEVVYNLNDRAKKANQSHFVYNWSNNFHMPMYYEVIRQHFPYVQKHIDYFNAAATIFSKNVSDSSTGLQKRKLSFSTVG